MVFIFVYEDHLLLKWIYFVARIEKYKTKVTLSVTLFKILNNVALYTLLNSRNNNTIDNKFYNF